MTAWTIATRAELGPMRIDVELEGGPDPVALIGPNASGKTSILRIMAGLLRPAHAEVVVGERTLCSTRGGVDLPAHERRIGYVPQGSGLFPNLCALDNVAFGLSVRRPRKPRAERRRLALATMRQLGCAHLAERWPGELSGGERQRVAVARALAIRPSLLLLDEPLAALDATARRSVRAFIALHLREAACPSILVTHEPRDVLALDATIIALEAGRIVQRGTFNELSDAPATAFVEAFVHGAMDAQGVCSAREVISPRQ